VVVWFVTRGAGRGRSAFVAAALMLCAAAVHAQPPAEHAQHASAQLFPAREASGTAWLPEATPTFGVMRSPGPWQVMFHGNAFAQWLYEPGDRHRTGGASEVQFSSVNWGMVMARRPIGAGRFGLRAMISVEPWTVADCGFLNYLATGEMCDGDTIHDRQHPHDLFMELAAEYDRPIAGAWRWQVYAGFSGEPALGPAAFPHRVSSLTNPVAPITHHWLDSSHISFGLVTTGVYQRRWKAEVSIFNGREPDSDRGNLDLAALDSVSGRLSFLPSERWALQVSSGHLTEAEAEFPPQPRSDLHRTTASATYHRPARGQALWATTLAWGVNAGQEIIATEPVDLVTHAALVESLVAIGDRHTWFGRMEVAGKPAHDLHADEYRSRVFTVGKLQAGYVRHFRPWHGLVPGVGATVSVSLLPSELAPRYSGRAAPGFGVFVVVRPPRHDM
jgi:hypothetical protein